MNQYIYIYAHKSYMTAAASFSSSACVAQSGDPQRLAFMSDWSIVPNIQTCRTHKRAESLGTLKLYVEVQQEVRDSLF